MLLSAACEGRGGGGADSLATRVFAGSSENQTTCWTIQYHHPMLPLSAQPCFQSKTHVPQTLNTGLFSASMTESAGVPSTAYACKHQHRACRGELLRLRAWHTAWALQVSKLHHHALCLMLWHSPLCHYHCCVLCTPAAAMLASRWVATSTQLRFGKLVIKVCSTAVMCASGAGAHLNCSWDLCRETRQVPAGHMGQGRWA